MLIKFNVLNNKRTHNKLVHEKKMLFAQIVEKNKLNRFSNSRKKMQKPC
jgi:hypothetical protein